MGSVLCKCKKSEDCSKTQSADNDKVFSSPHYPSCKTQGAGSIKHKDSLVRNKQARPNVDQGSLARHFYYAPVQFHCKKKKKTDVVLRGKLFYVKYVQNQYRYNLIKLL